MRILSIIFGTSPRGLAALPALIVGAALFGFAVPAPALAQDSEADVGHAHDPTDIWAIARGGQLYDKWYDVIEADEPEGTHPAYPADGKKKGATTWRCKECHGWDYKGRFGAYAEGSHFTGIKGVIDVAGSDPERLHQIIMNDTHGYSEAMMSHSAMEKLALFLTRGTIDMDLYIDRETKKARGDRVRGAAFFQTICAVCHGFDGMAMNFKTEDNPEYVGTVARANPWETLHKIRFGQPGVGMVALMVLSIQDQVDILAYTQTLPAK
jgi:thiosulfate dehydrogenase